MTFLLGWIFFLALYLNGVVYYIVLERDLWKKQGIDEWTWREINRSQLAWPWFMLSGTWEKLWTR